jgi:hypothetical protein
VTARRPPSILQVMRDENLLGRSFGKNWRPWESYLAALFGLTAPELRGFAEGRTERQDLAAGRRFRESWIIAGRRSGKSRILALIATYLSAFTDAWRAALAPGEKAIVAVLATDRDQAAVDLGYIKGLFASNPLLAGLITAETADSIELGTRRVRIEVATSNYRAVRGRTFLAVLCDEVAFWASDASANPAEETMTALRPGLATLAPHSMIIGASSPYAKAGLLWNQYRKHFGREHRELIWQAPSLEMNRTLDPEEIYQAYETDEAAAAAEWGAEFRTDVERLFGQAVIESATVAGRRELGRVPGIRYVAHVDPSGGSSDAMTVCIAHAEGERIILDALRSRVPPFSPEQVTEEFAALLATYGLSSVTGDRYGGEWPREQFRKHGVRYDFSALPASSIYLEALPLLNAGRVELLDDPKLTAQLVALERRTSRAGKDTVSHPPLGHDDSANSACGAMVLAKAKLRAKIDFATQAFIGRAYTDGLFINDDRHANGWGDFREHTDW